MKLSGERERERESKVDKRFSPLENKLNLPLRILAELLELYHDMFGLIKTFSRPELLFVLS